MSALEAFAVHGQAPYLATVCERRERRIGRIGITLGMIQGCTPLPRFRGCFRHEKEPGICGDLSVSSKEHTRERMTKQQIRTAFPHNKEQVQARHESCPGDKVDEIRPQTNLIGRFAPGLIG